MVTVFLLALICWQFYRVQVWRERYDNKTQSLGKISEEKDVLQKEHDFLKESVASWNTKPIYALLSDQQIITIAKTVAEAIKEPKWVN